LYAFTKQGLYANIKNEPTMADEVEALKSLHEACKDGKPLAQYTVANFGGQRGSPDRLNLTTIHSAKGLEYDVVIMMGMEQGLIPRYSATSEEQKREERRKFYVALTRARHEVHIIYSGWYTNRNGSRFDNGPSEFVNEIKRALIR